ncbi:MAG: hypothetical protein KDF64_19880 [Geminicoccaceae bacterium]|nr:hypothetical protein [Geminicoccaceae bacterium]
MGGSGHFLPFLGQGMLVFLQSGNARLVSLEDGGILGVGDAVEEIFDLFFDLRLFLAKVRQKIGRLLTTLRPSLPEHGMRQFKKPFCGPQAFEHRCEFAFDIVPPDRLAVARAVRHPAKIIGMLLARFARRPTGGQGRVAIATEDEAS